MLISEVIIMPEVVVRSRIKDYAVLGEKKLEVAAEVFPALCQIVQGRIKKAAERAKANGRNTIMARDL